jgi:hypothetical protein
MFASDQNTLLTDKINIRDTNQFTLFFKIQLRISILYFKKLLSTMRHILLIVTIKTFFPPNTTTCPYGLRGLPSWA